MRWRAAEARPIADFVLRVRFLDGTEGVVDMIRLVHSETAGVFRALADPAVFRQVRVECGAVTWPGDLDLAPDAMYRAITAEGRWTL